MLVTAYINFDEFDYCYDLSFKLLEYKDTPATYFSSDSKELKIKVGSINTVYEYGLLGEEPNGAPYPPSSINSAILPASNAKLYLDEPRFSTQRISFPSYKHKVERGVIVG